MSILPAPPAADLDDPTPPSPDLHQTSRRRLAALSLVGALMVVLPLVQVLRYQNAEIANLLATQAGLNPVAQAVGTQRSLLDHRAISAQVLRGALDKEPDRKVRQSEVDQRVKLLTLAVHGGIWERAEAEARALREDWGVLARQIAARSIGAGESDQEHRLLIEQVLQVIDLVGDEEPVTLGSATAESRAALIAALALPRVAARMAALAAPAPARAAPTLQRELADAEATLARTLGALDRALDAAQDAVGPSGEAPEGLPLQALRQASAAAGASAEHYFGILRSGRPAGEQLAGSTDEPRATAAQAALQAQFALFDLAHGSVRAELARREGDLKLHRNGLLLSVALLGSMALALLASLSRGLRPGAPPTPPARSGQAPAAERGAGGSRAEAGRVLQRLRVPAQGQPIAKADPARRDSQPTLPPES
jgi:hypothetical protein